MNNKCNCQNCNCNPCSCNKKNIKKESNNKMKKLFLYGLILIFALAITGCDNDANNGEPLPEGIIKTELTVWGMTCGRCIANIERTVLAVDGVIEVEVDLRDDLVTILHKESLDIERIKEVITEQGYNIP